MFELNDINGIKKAFFYHFTEQMKRENFLHFFYEVFTSGSAYIVGGYLRDFLNNKPSRDIDIIVDIEVELLIKILYDLNFDYSINRHGGVKIKLKTIEADVWTISNNWAFKNELVKLNEEDKLNSIAKGCFYNYDSLVINVNKLNINLRNYKDFLESKKLNILQESSYYKLKNPSMEANILRAIYLREIYDCDLTENTSHYIIKRLGYIGDNHKNVIERLLYIKNSYPKYEFIKEYHILKFIKYLSTDFNSKNQLSFDF